MMVDEPGDYWGSVISRLEKGETTIIHRVKTGETTDVL